MVPCRHVECYHMTRNASAPLDDVLEREEESHVGPFGSPAGTGISTAFRNASFVAASAYT